MHIAIKEDNLSFERKKACEHLRSMIDKPLEEKIYHWQQFLICYYDKLSNVHQEKKIFGGTIDIVDELIGKNGCIEMAEKALKNKDLKTLDKYLNLFMATVENELNTETKQKVLEFFDGFCMDILGERKYTLAARIIIQCFCVKAEKILINLSRD